MKDLLTSLELLFDLFVVCFTLNHYILVEVHLLFKYLDLTFVILFNEVHLRKPFLLGTEELRFVETCGLGELSFDLNEVGFQVFDLCLVRALDSFDVKSFA